MPPSSPKSAPDAPTEMFDCIKRAESRLPPKPERRYNRPILTAEESEIMIIGGHDHAEIIRKKKKKN